MKKITLLIFIFFTMFFSTFASWNQYQKDERHTGWECDVNIDLPLCIKWRAYIGQTKHTAVPVTDEVGYTYIIGGGRLQKIRVSDARIMWSKYASFTNTSPIIDGSRIIINDAFTFYAYDRNTGEAVWTSTIPGMTTASCMKSQFLSSYINDPSPVLAGGKLYIGTRNGKIIRLDSATGAVEGQFQVATDLIVASPAVDTDGILYVGSNDGYMYAINSATGALKWKRGFGFPIFGAVSVDNDGIYFATRAGKVYRINKVTAAIVWTNLTDSWMHAGGAVHDGVYYIGSDDRMVYAYNTLTGTLKWKSAFTGDNFAKMTCVVICARVFIVGCVNKLVSIDANTGAWDYTCTTQGSNFTNLSYSNGTLLFTSDDGYLYAMGKCETVCPCVCDGAKITPSPTPVNTSTATRTITRTVTPTVTKTFTASPTYTATMTATVTVTQTFSPVPTDTYTASPTFTPSCTPTASPTLTATRTNSPTVTPTFTATVCDGINPPEFEVVMINNPENSNNIIFEITSDVLLENPPHITVYPHGACQNKNILEFDAVLIPGETMKYRVLYPKQTGYGDIDKVIVKGKDLCGVEGISDGTFEKEVIPMQDVKIFKNVFNPDQGERATIRYKVYAGDTIQIKVYSKTGVLIKTLLTPVQKQAGEYEVTWDGTNEQGQKVASGIYIAAVECDYYQVKEKMSIIR